MSSVWTKCEGKLPCGLSDFVDVRYADGEESSSLSAGGLPWSMIVEWRFSEPWAAVRSAYLEGFWAGYGGQEEAAYKAALYNWPNSQAHDDAFEALRNFGGNAMLGLSEAP